ncbi:aspartate/glutamate racemase family protein [Jiella sp. KSK16Y-1]|uniref:Aspartate/glutamate racemase family protein n=2 Tax=Jiella mangrovi TaxID=2821407 RepID=A0ABS4BJ92_9HYPH|nr:aspartate/glutamate racemase family protein [Jiella mangrovi]MBP0616084.1 aspartate/glutamate racemase family protein [Jiella mangrovi]
MARILVLNPNSSEKVTDSIRRSVAGLGATTDHQLVFERLPAAPLGIEDDADVEAVGPMVRARALVGDADAVVVACFSDPGVDDTRSVVTDIPVIGVAEAGYYAALQFGRRFGVVSLGPASIARHAVRINRLGIAARLAGDRSADLTVEESGDEGLSRAKVIETGKALASQDGADVIVLGCAGMGNQRPFLQQAIGLPVIDPVQAGVAAAISALNLEYIAKA